MLKQTISLLFDNYIYFFVFPHSIYITTDTLKYLFNSLFLVLLPLEANDICL